jgi:hypothetical protein
LRAGNDFSIYGGAADGRGSTTTGWPSGAMMPCANMRVTNLALLAGAPVTMRKGRDGFYRYELNRLPVRHESWKY